MKVAGVPWVAILGFIRIATSPKILDNPFDVSSACAHVGSWLGSRRRLSFIPETAMQTSCSISWRRRARPAV